MESDAATPYVNEMALFTAVVQNGPQIVSVCVVICVLQVTSDGRWTVCCGQEVVLGAGRI